MTDLSQADLTSLDADMTAGLATFVQPLLLAFGMVSLVVAAAFNALLGPRGWVNLALMDWFNLAQPPIHFLNTFTAIIVAHVFYNTTIVLRIVGDFWAHLDPRLVQASQVLGANRRQTLLRVTLPLLAPAIAAAALLVFIFDFTSFGVVLILGGPRFACSPVQSSQKTPPSVPTSLRRATAPRRQYRPAGPLGDDRAGEANAVGPGCFESLPGRPRQLRRHRAQ